MANAKFNLDTFMSNFDGGARSYMFYIRPIFPTGMGSIQSTQGNSTEFATYLIRTSEIPDINVEEIMMNWQGYDYKLGGKFTFGDWTTSFNIDRGIQIYRMFLQWHSFMHNPKTNEHASPKSYMVDQIIQLAGYDGEPTLQMKLVGAFPKMIGQITLDYAQNEVANFDITWSYQYAVADNVSYGVSIPFAN